VAPGADMPQPAFSVARIHRDGPKPLCICADGRELPMSHLVAAHVEVGDEISAPASLQEPAADAEIYIRKPSLRRADIYNARISYAALPKPDRRSELFVRVQVVDSQSCMEAIHIPCAAISRLFLCRQPASTVAEPNQFLLSASTCPPMFHSRNSAWVTVSGGWNS